MHIYTENTIRHLIRHFERSKKNEIEYLIRPYFYFKLFKMISYSNIIQYIEKRLSVKSADTPRILKNSYIMVYTLCNKNYNSYLSTSELLIYAEANPDRPL